MGVKNADGLFDDDGNLVQPDATEDLDRGKVTARSLRALFREELDRLRSLYDAVPDNVVFEVTNNTSVGGTYNLPMFTDSGKHLIKASRHAADPEAAKDIIRHELAHMMAWVEDRCTDHGQVWKTHARHVGCKPKACSFKVDQEARRQKANYRVYCVDCGHEYLRQQRSKIVKKAHRYRCGECDGRLKSEDIS